MNDIENGMVVGAQEEFDRLSESHWEDDRNIYMIIKYAEERGLLAVAVTGWLGVEDDGAVYDRCMTVFYSMSQHTQEQILTEYIEGKDLTGDFNEWWEAKVYG